MNNFEVKHPGSRLTAFEVGRITRSAIARMAEARDLYRASGVLSDTGDEICLRLLDQANAKQHEANLLYEYALANGAAGNC